jgi:SET domain-containing protein
MRRQPDWGNCDVCGKAFDDVCQCRIPAMAGELMELVEYPFKGVGVRALAELRQGEILGEYLGELLLVYAPMKGNDYVYAFEMNVDGNEIPVGFIDPSRYGNWTRFLNHSCNGSTEFKSCIAGPNVSNLCSAKRDIALFEEVTIHYGAAYWLTRTCKCGSANCILRVGS